MNRTWKPDNTEIVAIFIAMLIIVCAYAYIGILYLPLPIIVMTIITIFGALFVYLAYGAARKETDNRLMMPVGIAWTLAFVFLVINELLLRLPAFQREIMMLIFLIPTLAATLTQLAYVLLARDQKTIN